MDYPLWRDTARFPGTGSRWQIPVTPLGYRSAAVALITEDDTGCHGKAQYLALTPYANLYLGGEAGYITCKVQGVPHLSKRNTLEMRRNDALSAADVRRTVVSRRMVIDKETAFWWNEHIQQTAGSN